MGPFGLSHATVLVPRAEDRFVGEDPSIDELTLAGHGYVNDVVVRLLGQRKFKRQIILSTHNPSIPAISDAELIHALDVRDRMAHVDRSVSIDVPSVKDRVTMLKGAERPSSCGEPVMGSDRSAR